jgi:hypothetical protein
MAKERERLMDVPERIDAVVEIVGEDHRAHIESVMRAMSELQEQWELARAERWSKGDKTIAKRYRETLVKMADRLKKTPSSKWHEFVRQLDFLNGMFAAVAIPPLQKRGGPNEAVARAKELSAHAALIICQNSGTKPTTTKVARNWGAGSKFCKIAARLYGERNADLQYQCRQMLQLDQAAKKRGQK